MVPLQASVDGFLHVCKREHTTTILLQADVGANDETTPTKAQTAARKEFAILPIGRQQGQTASTEQSKKFDAGGCRGAITFRLDGCLFRFAFLCPHGLSFSVVSTIFPSRYERRREFPIKDGRD